MTKKEHIIEMSLLEHSMRTVLERQAIRGFAVLNPLKLIIDNWPADKHISLPAARHPDQPELGTRQIAFGRELYIEQDDFTLEPPKGYRRLSPGRDIRLRYGYILHCGEPELDAEGKVTAVHCTFYEDSRSGQDVSGVKAGGVIHWLPASTAVPACIRLYDRLLITPNPEQVDDITEAFNDSSLIVCQQALVESSVAEAPADSFFQFERTGYFVRDIESTSEDLPVFNRTITLRDTWAKTKK